MAGEARTSEFLLSTATLMVGPSDKVMELTPAEHSLGLIKNVQVSTDMSMTELTQGLQNTIVASVSTSVQSRISGEVYEYSGRNLAYGAGLDGSAAAYAPITTSFTLASAIASGGTTVALATGQGSTFAVGDFVVLQDTATGDRVHVGKVASKSSDTLTLASTYAMPSGMAFTVLGTTVFRVMSIKVGALDANPTFGAKLVGIMPGTGEPLTLIFPKIKITKGINLAFQSDNWSNMPFEFVPYNLVDGDPFFSDFGSKKQWMVLRR
jgi:hypothetical protein